jgi:transposase-like protein
VSEPRIHIHGNSGLALATWDCDVCPICGNSEVAQNSLTSDERIELRIGRLDYFVCQGCGEDFVRDRKP